ncbi:MAG TPA: M18 family aminopeptidase, partial [Halanaerobiales bacterium]|nr:M18 family aminopeptidase [Halanaerobiales bacterium]
MKGNSEINELISFINDSPTAFHAASNIEQILSKEGFQKLDSSEPWEIKSGEKYYLARNNSAIIAFVVGKRPFVETGFRIIGAHLDSPALKIKPSPLIKEQGYCKINTEPYGSPVLSTWFDRMLSLAGKVVWNADNPFAAEKMLIRVDKPLLIIPNLAIHLNRDINKGCEINPQKELLPIITMKGENYSENLIKELIAEEIGAKSRQINDYELFIYPFEKGN